MAEAIYLLCAVASVVCAGLLLRGYARTRVRFLAWSSLCFVGLAVNNLLLFVDLVVLPNGVSLAEERGVAAMLALVSLVVGLVWDS
jgi:hypothetical protein